MSLLRPTPESPRPSRRRPLIVVSVGLHFVVMFGLFVAGFWKLDRLEAGHRSVDIAYFPSPPEGASGVGAPGADGGDAGRS